MAFMYTQKILFKYCDPAGIVFYPRYFEIINDCVETFFDAVLDFPFEKLLKTGGVPTVSISTDFNAPSRHGDLLRLDLRVLHLGNTSMTLNATANCEDEKRFVSKSTLVRVDENGRPAKWPSEVATKIREQMEEKNGD